MLDAAKQVADQYNIRVEESQDSMMQANDIDAVIITSASVAHEESVLKAIAASKFCFCEKPLAVTAEGCKRIIDAEISAGKKLVQVGFMRRYDEGYNQVKDVLQSKRLGEPLVLHCTHRNPEVDENYHTSMMITETVIHEIDILHWLTDDTYVSAQVIMPRPTKYTHDKLADPQIVILRTAKGIYIEIEAFVNCQFAYDIECEVVCENGLVKLPQPANVTIMEDGKQTIPMETSWKHRFIKAYDIELQDWVNNTIQGTVSGPTAWDGYVASVTANACVKHRNQNLLSLLRLLTSLNYTNK